VLHLGDGADAMVDRHEPMESSSAVSHNVMDPPLVGGGQGLPASIVPNKFTGVCRA
jgi:hypothetical protein